MYSDRGDSAGKNGIRESESSWGEDLWFRCRGKLFELCVLPCECWALVKVGSCVDLSVFLDLNSPALTSVVNQRQVVVAMVTEKQYSS